VKGTGLASLQIGVGFMESAPFLCVMDGKRRTDTPPRNNRDRSKYVTVPKQAP
jgi:hypothetical protein